MTVKMRNGGWIAGAAVVLGVLALAQAPALADDAKNVKKENTAIKPAPKDVERHKGFLEVAKKGNVDVLFLGDSITDAWRSSGKEVWKVCFEPLKAANFGIGGDQTQHVLWRLQNGELEGIQIKAAVVMIGTNNLRGNTEEQIAEGIKAIVEEIHKRQPQAKVLLLGVFPRNPKADDPIRARIKKLNEIISKLDDGKQVRFLDFGQKFLDEKGDLSKEIMPDFLHLSPKGYQIWADAVKKPLEEMLKQ